MRPPINHQPSTIARPPAIAIEIGGTALRIGLVDRRGRVLQAVRLPSADLRDQSRATERLLAHLTEFLWEEQISLDKCAGIGIAAAGYVDNEARAMVVASNLGWRDFHLGREIEDLTGRPVVMDKDTNMAALGELVAGSGRRLRSFIYAALGTGVGGAIIHDGRLLRGRRNGGGDFGHVYAGGDAKCGCGFTGCLEAVAGGVAIARRAQAAIRQGRASAIRDMVGGRIKDITAKTVGQAAEQGDVPAQEFLADAGKAVGVALVNIIRMVGPEAVIIGGSLGGERLVFEAIKASVEPNSVFPGTDIPRVRVLPASLGDSGALVGAGLAVFGQGQ